MNGAEKCEWVKPAGYHQAGVGGFCIGALVGAWLAGWAPLPAQGAAARPAQDGGQLLWALLGAVGGGGVGAIPGVVACVRGRRPPPLAEARNEKPYTWRQFFQDAGMSALNSLVAFIGACAIVVCFLLLLLTTLLQGVHVPP